MTTEAPTRPILDPIAFQRAQQRDQHGDIELPPDHPLARTLAKRTEAAREAAARIHQAALREALAGVEPDGDQLAADISTTGMAPDDYFAKVGDLIDLATAPIAASDGERLMHEAIEAKSDYQIRQRTHAERMKALKSERLVTRRAMLAPIERENALRQRLDRYFREVGIETDAAPLWRALEDARRIVADAQQAVVEAGVELDLWRRRSSDKWSASKRRAMMVAEQNLAAAQRQSDHLRRLYADLEARPVDAAKTRTPDPEGAGPYRTRNHHSRMQLGEAIAKADALVEDCKATLDRAREIGDDPDRAVEAGLAKAEKALAAAERSVDGKKKAAVEAWRALAALAAQSAEALKSPPTSAAAKTGQRRKGGGK